MEGYLKLIKTFWLLNKKHHFNASTIALYFYLLSVWEESEYAPFSISQYKIMKELSVSRPTIRQSKKVLLELGVIKFEYKRGAKTKFQIETKLSDLVFNNNAEKSKQLSLKTSQKKPLDKPKRKINNQSDIPSLEEFLAYAKTLEIYTPNLDFQIKTKYKTWKDNGWKNGYGNPIRKWKNSLASTMPHFASGNNNVDMRLPTINRPKSTYNE